MITVIITTYKRKPDVINRAILSIIKQTYKEWELIVVDDSPCDWLLRDEVRQAIIHYADSYKVEYIANAKNYGACYSRNIGLQKAQGEYIAYLDDDDEWLPEKLEEQLRILENSSEDTALVYGPYYRLIENTGEKKLIDCPLLSGKLYDELMIRGNFFGGMSMPLMRTKCVIDVGGFDELMQSAQDMDLWLRLAKKYNVVRASIPLVIYHVNDSEHITNNPRKKVAGLRRLIEKNKEYLLGNKTAHWRMEGSIIPYLIKMKDKKAAYKTWKKTVYICPYKIKSNFINLARIIMNREP